jgi:hypothetical protein
MLGTDTTYYWDPEEVAMALSRITLGGALALGVVAVSSEALADCYVDSQGGDDTSNDGQSEASPFQSQAPLSGCGTVYYKRGSRFNEPVKTSAGSTFTNYGNASDPLPAFVTTDGVVNSFQGGITIDGLHLEGSMGDGTMQSMGVCVTLGGNSQLLNSEITDCDIGIMLFGDNSLVQGNLVYDLDRMAVDDENNDVYANSVGGAEGIFVNGSNNEVAYNSFINCKAVAAWQSEGDQIGYDGGATEVAVSQDGEVTGLRVHHNYAYNTCGFFEVSGFGVFSDSEFYYNVSVDSAWAMLLQVNETTLSNIRWENNTFVHHADAYTPSIAMIYRAELTPGTVIFNNNIVIFDGANTFNATLDDAMSASNNLIVDYDPGVVNLAGIEAVDFDLLQGSEAIDAGLSVPGHTLDFLNRVVPAGGATDIGAFEYGAEESDGGAPSIPDSVDPTGGAGGGTGGESTTTETGGTSSTTGGTSSTTGGTSSTTGGTSSTDPSPSTGGTSSTDPSPSTGGTSSTDPSPSTGGASSTNPPSSAGGASSTPPAPAAGGSSQPPAAAGGAQPAVGNGGTVSGDQGSATEGTSAVGDSTAAGPQGEADSTQNGQIMQASDAPGCACEAVGSLRPNSHGRTAPAAPAGSSAALLLLAAAALLRRRRQV